MTKQRILFGVAGIIIAFFWITGLWVYLGDDSSQRDILLGRNTPYSIQSITWIFFFIGLSELWLRWLESLDDKRQYKSNYLPEDSKTVLRGKDLGIYFKKANNATKNTPYFLPSLIKRIILRFHSSRSIEQANLLLNTSLEFRAHEIEQQYAFLKYIVWLLPTLGFIGTVIGIMQGLTLIGVEGTDQIESILTDVINLLAIAFNTTFVALILSAILMLLINLTQTYEENILNKTGQYCLDNLIGRLYVSHK